MMKGIGIDMVFILEIERFIRGFGETYLLKTYSEIEREYAERGNVRSKRSGI